MADSETQRFHVSADALFEQVLETVATLGYSIQHTDGEARTVSFNTGFSVRSSAGQDMTATVFEAGDSESRIVLGGRRAQRGGIFGGGGQLFDWGEKGHITRKLFESLTEKIARLPASTPSRSTSPTENDIASQLERLAMLRQNGSITDSEFETAKRKILGTD